MAGAAWHPPTSHGPNRTAPSTLVLVSSPAEHATRLLNRLCRGDSAAADELTPLLVDELRRLAQSRLAEMGGAQTLDPTALVNEAFIRLVQLDEPDWPSRRHFFAMASKVMRSVLVDHARRRGAAKRGGDGVQVTLDLDRVEASAADALDVLALDEALRELAEVDERLVSLAELRLFGGLDMAAVARSLDVSLSTAERRWRVASTWLRDRLADA